MLNLNQEEIIKYIQSADKTDRELVNRGLGMEYGWIRNIMLELGAIKAVYEGGKWVDVIARDYPIAVVSRKNGDSYIDTNGDLNVLKKKINELKTHEVSAYIIWVPKMYEKFNSALREFDGRNMSPDIKPEMTKEMELEPPKIVVKNSDKEMKEIIENLDNQILESLPL